ncbi:MAG: Holliday junction branch migration protein RuvA [Candidatus Dormibacteraceae bacterium]
MIGYLSGRVVRTAEEQVVIETGGVGYLVSVPLTARERAGKIGAKVELHIHTQVREDQLALFGFLSVEELEMFQLLIQVDGVGPKVGLAILSTASLDVLRRSILQGEVAPIRRASGVGPRTAQKVIIDLRPKLEAERALLMAGQPPVTDNRDGGEVATQVEIGLRSLGFGPLEARRGVAAIDWSGQPEVQVALAAALKALGR